MCFIKYHSRTHLLLIVFFLVCGLSGSSLIGWIRAAVLLRLGFLSIFLPSARPIWNAMYDSKFSISFQVWDTSDAGILIFIFIIRLLRLLGWTVEERKIRQTKIRLNLILIMDKKRLTFGMQNIEYKYTCTQKVLLRGSFFNYVDKTRLLLYTVCRFSLVLSVKERELFH